ncbi:MAG: hypothetical protein ACRCW2_01530 [Cellulosilyticaceae bacterium]
MNFQDTMYDVLNELLKDKQSQRRCEEALIRYLPKPLYRKWLDERVQMQLKHERIIGDVCKNYLGKVVEPEENKRNIQMKRYVVDELEVRLDDVTRNIQLLNQTVQGVDDFKTYKMLQSILVEEQLYEGQLIKMLCQR